MIISNLIGGLGNQMFQYAAGRSLSLEMFQEHCLDIKDLQNYKLHQGYQLEHIFKAKFKVASSDSVRTLLGYQGIPLFRKLLKRKELSLLRSKKYIIEPNFSYWNGFNKLQSDVYLYGYWQSEKYFRKNSDVIRADFVFRQKLSELNEKISHQIAHTNAVSLHVRRGDYLVNARTKKIHGIVPLKYYQQAISIILSNVLNPHFYIFSDDPAWVKDNIKLREKCTYIDHNHGEESYNDMRLMSMCKHHIIANSSFSWWGAWLNNRQEKMVIAPKNWFGNGIETHDLIPSEWVRI